MEHKEIINMMNDIQIATMGEKSQGDADYIADINKRIGEIENGLANLKHELTKQGLNNW